MSEWCQNKKCCYKKNQSQMRGSKGNKYYQSNKAHKYYDSMFCSQGCFHSYLITNETTVFNVVPEIDRQTIGVERAWEFKYERNYNNVDNREDMYFLINRLQGVHHVITREQAQTPDQIRQDYGWQTRPDLEAKPLAIQLGLAS